MPGGGSGVRRGDWRCLSPVPSAPRRVARRSDLCYRSCRRRGRPLREGGRRQLSRPARRHMDRYRVIARVLCLCLAVPAAGCGGLVERKEGAAGSVAAEPESAAEVALLGFDAASAAVGPERGSGGDFRPWGSWGRGRGGTRRAGWRGHDRRRRRAGLGREVWGGSRCRGEECTGRVTRQRWWFTRGSNAGRRFL